MIPREIVYFLRTSSQAHPTHLPLEMPDAHLIFSIVFDRFSRFFQSQSTSNSHLNASETVTTHDPSTKEVESPNTLGLHHNARGESSHASMDTSQDDDTDPEALKVRDWQHELQRKLLDPKRELREEDVPDIDIIFRAIEEYEGITVEKLQYSKLAEVLRHISTLPDDKVPGNDKFMFKQRAKVLVESWKELVVDAAKYQDAVDETRTAGRTQWTSRVMTALKLVIVVTAFVLGLPVFM
ncbi:hypothetical protein AN958_12690 [Leucoagaricus sp. SymC.cos]|nr:hypothetical protein AN958_12690 [Leucoagaricus sp. SymC.cos]